MRASAAAACLVVLAAAVPLALADAGEPDYVEPPATTSQADQDYDPQGDYVEVAGEVPGDYVDDPAAGTAVNPEASTPEMAVAPMAPAPADGPSPSAAEPAGPPMEVDEMWDQCLEKLGPNNTHSLADIVTGPFEQEFGGPSVFLPLLEKLDDETLELVMDFDLSGEGYTLILPTNTARDFNATGPQATGDVFEVYGFDANTSTSAEVTEVLQAHVLPGTITFTSIKAALEDNATYTVTSLQGYEWTFALAEGEGILVDAGNSSANSTGGTYPVLIDNHNLTDSGFFNIKTDLRLVPDCPNVVIASTDGFFAAPQYLTTEVEAPAPAPAPAPVPAPAPAPEADAPEPEPEAPEELTPGGESEAGTPPDAGTGDPGAAAGAGAGLIAATAAGAVALTLSLL